MLKWVGQYTALQGSTLSNHHMTPLISWLARVCIVVSQKRFWLLLFNFFYESQNRRLCVVLQSNFIWSSMLEASWELFLWWFVSIFTNLANWISHQPYSIFWICNDWQLMRQMGSWGKCHSCVNINPESLTNFLITVDQMERIESCYLCEVLHFLLKKRHGAPLVKLPVDLVDKDNEAALNLLCALFKHCEW